MSIISQATQRVHDDGWATLLVIAAISTAAIVLAVRVRVFQQQSIIGPARIAEGEPLGGVLIGLLGGFLLWLMIPAFILAGSMPKLPDGPTTIPAEPATRSAASQIPTDKLVVASTISAVAAFAAMVAVSARLRKTGLHGLGLSLRQLPAGIKAGLIGACIMVPVVFLAAQLTEALWQKLSYQHEKEHQLLKLLGESERPWLSAVLFVSAVVVAPLFEEALFRGHLQTLLAHFFHRLSSRPPGQGLDVIPPTDPITGLPLFQPPPPPPVPVPPPGAGVRWAAVVITALLFSAVHPAWTIPPIFVLACCLGYAYERTANLWTVIVMHAVFNLTSTVIFLNFARQSAGAARW